MAALLESARQELGTSKPEQYKIFLLGAMAGLRRNEIDKLPWNAFRWNKGFIRIQATEFFRPKSHESEGDVLVDPELLEIFRGYFARRKGDFVIESDSEPDSRWAMTADEWFVDSVMRAWSEWPAMHIYHFTSYEPSALKRLMGRHSTREDEIDRMLRAGLLSTFTWS